MVQHYDPHHFDSRNSLGYLLKTTHAMMHDCGERIFANSDISFVQWIALLKINEGTALTASDLCREMRHDNGALTRLLDQLESLGYVVRQRSQQDRRVVDLQITESGRAKLKELTPQIINNLNAALEPFTAEEFAELIRLLLKLKTRLHEYNIEQTSQPT